jgi:hypothetical protein
VHPFTNRDSGAGGIGPIDISDHMSVDLGLLHLDGCGQQGLTNVCWLALLVVVVLSLELLAKR